MKRLITGIAIAGLLSSCGTTTKTTVPLDTCCEVVTLSTSSGTGSGTTIKNEGIIPKV